MINWISGSYKFLFENKKVAVVLFHLNSGHKYLKGKDEQAANNNFCKKYKSICLLTQC